MLSIAGLYRRHKLVALLSSLYDKTKCFADPQNLQLTTDFSSIDKWASNKVIVLHRPGSDEEWVVIGTRQTSLMPRLHASTPPRHADVIKTFVGLIQQLWAVKTCACKDMCVSPFSSHICMAHHQSAWLDNVVHLYTQCYWNRRQEN